MALGALLLSVGFMLIRPINFAVGCYLGGSITLLLITLFAPVTTGCGIIVWFPVFAALGVGGLCAWKRGSMFAIIGLIIGEIAGRLVYNLTMRPLGLPEYLAFSCISFFSVVVLATLPLG